MTTEQMLASAVIGVCAALVYVYKRGEDKNDARYEELRRRADACDEDRTNLWTEMGKLMGGPKTDP